MDHRIEELRVAIAGINQGSVQRALYLVLKLLEQPCKCVKTGDMVDINDMYPEQGLAIPEDISQD